MKVFVIYMSKFKTSNKSKNRKRLDDADEKFVAK